MIFSLVDDMFKKIKITKTKKKIIALVSLLFIALFIYNYLFKANITPLQDIKVVEIEKVVLKDISKTTRLIGTIKAKNSSILTAQDAGVLNIIAQAGTTLNKNDSIAKIENNEIEKNYNLSLSAQVIAKEQLERAKRLLKSGTFSKNEFEKVKSYWILAEKDLAMAKKDFEKLQIRAPFNGILGSYKAREGAQLKTGDLIASFYDPSSLIVEFDIPSSVVQYISAGQKLLIMGKEYKLTHVQKMLDESKHMSPASVEINCNDCLIGSNVDVDLSLVEKKQVIVIPFEAIFLKQGKPSIYVIENNQASLKKVELGLREKEFVEIISGLEVGEAVVVHGTSRLYPSVHVKIHQPE